MREDQIQIGSKVIPFQKTAKGWEEDINEYKNHTYGYGKFLKKNGYLYVTEYDEYEKTWILSDDINADGDYFNTDGDFFNPEDFEPFDEEEFNQQLIKNAVDTLKSKGITPEIYEQLWNQLA